MNKRKSEEMEESDGTIHTVLARFKSEKGEILPETFNLPGGTTAKQLEGICNSLLQQEEPVPISFFINDVEVVGSLQDNLKGNDCEQVIDIVYQPQAVFKVRAVTRCTGSIEGHREAVISVAFSPNGESLASGSGDTTVRFWDIHTQTPLYTCEGHKHWVLCISWSPCGSKLASASGHTKSVTCVRWGGRGLIYSGSQDRSIRVWRAEDGVLCRVLDGHAHWVNTLALNVDYALRTGHFEIVKNPNAPEDLQERALKRYQALGDEKLVSGSDDFTLYLWNPEKDKKPIARMTGHRQLVNDVKFSPDGRLIASASFDKSIKLWEAVTGKFIKNLHGHIQAVFSIAWSADSRLLVSGSSDSTLKVWDVKAQSLAQDLPGHADQVYAVDWSPDAMRVASGGKDKVLRLWQN
ncbi:GSCOCG00009975001-RA-CDS [Cotesia congregata]|nr:GSCOCG00009975001-RA-CDS [Cotesia congregata]